MNYSTGNDRSVGLNDKKAMPGGMALGSYRLNVLSCLPFSGSGGADIFGRVELLKVGLEASG